MTNGKGGETVTVTMTREEAEALMRATSELPYALMNAAAIFEMLRSGISNGYLSSDDRAVIATMELASKALSSFADVEGDEIGKLYVKLMCATRKDAA